MVTPHSGNRADLTVIMPYLTPRKLSAAVVETCVLKYGIVRFRYIWHWRYCTKVAIVLTTYLADPSAQALTALYIRSTNLGLSTDYSIPETLPGKEYGLDCRVWEWESYMHA